MLNSLVILVAIWPLQLLTDIGLPTTSETMIIFGLR